jgi:3',5'-cyclic AMP phosphodiesterase CpdA
MQEVPVLQIIHVSDLHFCDGYSDQAKLAREGRMWRLWLRRVIEKRDGFGWHEGTLDHDETAAAAFQSFLQDMRAEDGEWFPDEVGTPNPPTWLIDTGDATTFGDAASFKTAQTRLGQWRDALQGCEVRWLYGNHDAWPGTQPGVVAGPGFEAIGEAQRNLILEWEPWQPHRWLDPLVAQGPNGVRIECYALDTVSFGWWDNLRAIGRIDGKVLSGLCNQIASRDAASALRILATHHPIAFPYEARDESKWFVQQMVLAQSGKVIERLRNETEQIAALRPYVHLFLAGHTHLGMPGQRLPNNVKEAYQGELGKTQLQLVAGALQLVRDREALKEAIGPQVLLKDRVDFSAPWVFDANQQFQILRFYFDPKTKNGLRLERQVMARLPNDPEGYRAVDELSSSTFVHLSS